MSARRSWSPLQDPDGSLRVPLTRGLFARIDAADLALVADRAWTAHRRGGGLYVQAGARINGRKTVAYLHRVLVGARPGQLVDHRNGDTLDNRRENLRLCTPVENSRNKVSSQRAKRGRYKGVFLKRKNGKWRASIGAGERAASGKARTVHLGTFRTEAEAARAYDAAALAHFGEFAALNFPREAPAVNEEASS